MDDTTWLQQFREDARDYPATMAMGTLWIAVFTGMLATQATSGGGLTWRTFCLGTQNGLAFGALTLRDFYAGDIWRLVTASFVHFGVIHIGLNLYALYQLGCLVESWYGPGPFLAIYVLTGAGGNLLSAIFRHALQSNPSVICAGGSTVVMGLVALCAVVGWISRSRSGDHLRNQMLLVIFLTGALGFGFWAVGVPVIDNWGHAGGSLVGAFVGLGNSTMIRLGRGKLARTLGWAGVLVMATAATAQVNKGKAADARLIAYNQDKDDARRKAQQELEDARRKAQQELQSARIRFQINELLIKRLEEIRKVYRIAAIPRAITRGSLVREVPRKPIMVSPPIPNSPPPAVQGPALPTAEQKKERDKGDAASPAASIMATPEGMLKVQKEVTQAPAPARSPVNPPAPPSTPPPFALDPEQEFRLLILTSSRRLLLSLTNELGTGENSAEFRRAEQILTLTLTDLPTIEEVREFDDHLLTMISNLRKEQLAARDRFSVPRK